ncbi:MAG: prepilin-type N-terminal cleavage/methylation domain-containing protein [Pseudomonadota bacterium]
MNKADLRTVRPRGFSLLETLVAISILALTVTVIYQAQAHSLRNLGQSLAHQRAVLHAQSLLAELTGPLAPRQNMSGDTSDGYHWELVITPTDLPPPRIEQDPVPMQRLDLTLNWHEGGKPRELKLTTLAQP